MRKALGTPLTNYQRKTAQWPSVMARTECNSISETGEVKPVAEYGMTAFSTEH
jgi:hypothetical protein